MTGWLRNNRNVFSQFWRMGSPRSRNKYGPAFWCIESTFSLYPNMGAEVKDLSVASFIRTLILFRKARLSWLITSKSFHLLTPSPWGLWFQCMNLGGCKYSDHSIHHLRDCSIFQVRNTPGLKCQKIGKLFGGWNKQSLIKKIVDLIWNASRSYLLHIKWAIDLRRLFKV